MSSTAKSSSRPIRGWRWWTREFLAILIWLAIILGLYLSRHVDSETRNHILKVLTFEDVSITVFLLLGTSWLIGLRTMWHVAFVAAYPLIIPLRILPKICIKHWPVLFVFLPGIRGLVREMRLRSGLFCIALAAVIGSFSFSHPALLLSCWIVLCGYLFMLFVHQFHMAYRPVTAYSELFDILQRISNWLPSPKELAAKLKGQSDKRSESNLDPEKSRAANLFILYGVSTCLHYVARHLNDLQRSFKLDIYLVWCVVKSFALTVLIFTLIFASMGQSDAKHFKMEQGADFLDYSMFSFCNLMTSDTSGVAALSKVARSFACMEQLFAFALLVLVVFVVFTSLRERHRKDLQMVVTRFESASSAISEVFESDFELTRNAVEGILMGFAPTIAQHLIAIQHGKAYAERLYEESKRTLEAKMPSAGTPPADSLPRDPTGKGTQTNQSKIDKND